MSNGAFSIKFEREAERDPAILEKEHRVTILKEIQRYLSISPYTAIKTRLKRMSGFSPTLYRLRVGDFRVYYRIYQQKVVILGILHKKDSGRWLKAIA